MYIDFIDTLRNIQNGIYPQIKEWVVDAQDIRDQTQAIKDETKIIAAEAVDSAGRARASELNSQEWANNPSNYPVADNTWDPEKDILNRKKISPDVFSSKHWAEKAIGHLEKDKLEAMAAEMTAWSYSNEAHGNFVIKYTSMGDGKFKEHVMDNVFSALHWGIETETLTGHKRWVETIECQGCTKLMTFSKNINHADVYINGIRRVEVKCYSTFMNEITFVEELQPEDIVTVSGMEAITGSECQSSLSQIKKHLKDVQQLACESTAAQMTTQSYAAEAPGVVVKEYKCIAGNIHGTDTTYYSMLHWSKKIDEQMSELIVVDLYSDLRQLTSRDAKAAYVRGGYRLNDGREGIFVWDTTGTCINNGGTVINGWVRQYTGPLDVTWFGEMGDGATDCTGLLREALKWDDEIHFPEGDYLISDTIEFRAQTITAINVNIIASQLKGTAVKIANMKNGEGIYGDMTVIWQSHRKDTKKVSFDIRNSYDAQFDLGSEEATTGIMLTPVDGPVANNEFNIKEMRNNTIGVYLNGEDRYHPLEHNRFQDGDYVQHDTVHPSHYDADIACHIYSDSEDIVGNDFENVSLRAFNNTRDTFMLFRFAGTKNLLTVSHADIQNDSEIYGVVSGDFNTLNIRQAPRLLAYLNEFKNDGRVSTIDISKATNLTILGVNDLHDIALATMERRSHNATPVEILENDLGLSSYYPVVQKHHDVIEILHEKTNTNLLMSANSSHRTSEDERQSVITGDDGQWFYQGNKTIIKPIGIDVNSRTDHITGNYIQGRINLVDDKTNSLAEVFSSLIRLSDVYAQIEIDTALIKMTRATFMMNLGTTFLEFTDTQRAEKTRLELGKLEITKGAYSFVAESREASLVDGISINKSTARDIEISDKSKSMFINVDHLVNTDGTKVLDAGSDKVMIRDGGKINTNTATDATLRTAGSTSVRTSDELSIDSGNGKAKLTDDTLKFETTGSTTLYSINEASISDGTHTTRFTKEKWTLDDSPDHLEIMAAYQRFTDGDYLGEFTKKHIQFGDIDSGNVGKIFGTHRATLSRNKLLIEDSSRNKLDASSGALSIFDTTKDRLDVSNQQINLGDGKDIINISKHKIDVSDVNDRTEITADSVKISDTHIGASHNNRVEMTKDNLIIDDNGGTATLIPEKITFDRGNYHSMYSYDMIRMVDADGRSEQTPDHMHIERHVSGSTTHQTTVRAEGFWQMNNKLVDWNSNNPDPLKPHEVGDMVFNETPAAGGYIGKVCVVAGTPGTWKSFGRIEA